MTRRIIALLTMLCLLAGAAVCAAAEEGWNDTDYEGYYVEVPQDWQFSFKLPSDWEYSGYGGSVSGFARRSGGMSLAIYWIDESFRDYADRLASGGGDYLECSYITLNQGRSWFIGRSNTTFDAICSGSDSDTALYFSFEVDGSADLRLARQIISSVRSK